MRRCSLLSLVALGMALCVPGAAEAQGDGPPKIKRGADPNDWEAYFDAGIADLGRDRNIDAAEAALTWAARLRPDRAEPLHALWITFWRRDVRKFGKYVRGDREVRRDPDVIRADSLRLRALWRNPFVHEGQIVMLYDRMPGYFNDDQATRGWIAMARGQLPSALESFGSLLRKEPRRYRHLRFTRASAFVNLGRPDSATVEITTLLQEVRAAEDSQVVSVYESKELLEYALGLLHLQAGRARAAREAFGRSIGENAGFAPAHAKLGDLAIARRDTSTALISYESALAVDPNDLELMLGYGRALLLARRTSEAIAQFQKVVEREPLYAAPYLLLASALEEDGQAAGAGYAYRQFLSRATKTDPQRTLAEQKAKALPK